MAGFDEAGEAADGEAITNKIPRIEGGLIEGSPQANRPIPEMCPIDARFKHFQASKAKEFQQRRKLSSIMWAKVLSIMPAIAGRVRPD